MFTRTAWFRFYHGTALNALLARAIGHPLPQWCVPCPLESGQTVYYPGDRYHSGVTLAGRGRPDADALESAIRTAISQAPDGVPLGRTVHLEAVEPLDCPDLHEQISSIRKRSVLTLRFVTPLALRQHLGRGQHRVFDENYFDVAYFFSSLHSRLHRLRYPDCAPAARRLTRDQYPQVELRERHLAWFDADLGQDRDREHVPQYQGVLGQVVLSGDFNDWASRLVLGQYLHLGRRTQFGFGRYVIEELPGARPVGWQPARTLLDRTAAMPNLRQAWSDVRLNAGAAGVDGETIAEVADIAESRLARLSESLKRLEYRPVDLLGVVCPKPSGGVRALAIPSVTDRIAQRAAAIVLGPIVDQLLEDSSYAYRRGLSRHSARDALERAWKDGFRFVVETDIEDFFDAIDWERLFDRLDALWPGEPLVSVLRLWVEQPVVFHNVRIQRTRGLPQGSSIAPILANLFLDRFDEEMAQLGFRLVRYADDFVIACKTRDDADRALTAARQSLEQIGLDLNEEKTRVTDFDSGFRYLGFLFLKSTVYDAPAAKSDTRPNPGSLEIPTTSWLAALDARTLTELTRDFGRGRAHPPARLVAPGPTGSPAYVFARTGFAVKAALQGDRVVVWEGDDIIGELPLHELSHLVLVGNVVMTMPSLMALQEAGVPVFCCARDGELVAQFDPRRPQPSLWLAQAARAENPAFRLEFARRIVAAVLNNQAVFVRRLAGGAANASQFAEIRQLVDATRHAESVDALRGLEGRGAALFFDFMEMVLDEEWGFDKRTRRPPADPVNVMISYGQSILYNHISTLLTAHGLLPHIGWYHRSRGTHHALASDLQEPLRPIVNGLIVYLVRRRIVRPDHFERRQHERYPCLMTDRFRRRFTEHVDERLRTRFRPPGGAREMSYLEFIADQCRQVRDLALQRSENFDPLRLR
ncbi:MAG: hypothetical protein Kow0074_20080 [Candidatus Zixiibacteriota bacterium]